MAKSVIGEPRDVLRQRQPHREPCVGKAEDAAQRRGRRDPAPERRAEVDRHPAAEGARHEDALDAEVEHARPLAQQRAEDAEHERRGDPQRGGEEAVGEQEVEHQPPRLRRRRAAASPSRIATSAIATTRSAR